MADIQLFVCCHRPAAVPDHPLLVPIQVGAALAGSRFPGCVHDDTGDGISAKNPSYCELTAQYWAWKNARADHLGFFHYRRYLYPDPDARRPYRIEREPDRAVLDRLGYRQFDGLIRRYDLIVPKPEDMFLPVREHYARAAFHHGQDLALAERIVLERHPEMAEAMEGYLSGSACLFGNIYIMRRTLFQDYCAWLFPILEEFDRRADTTGYTPQELRVDGYLAERLLGVYVSHSRARGAASCLELPRVHFLPDLAGTARRLLAAVLPPGTKRRAAVKNVWARTKGRER